MPADAETSQQIVILTASFLSLAVLFYLFQKHIDGRSLLTYQPRRRVPWGLLVGLFAISIPMLNILVPLLSNLLIPTSPEAAKPPVPIELDWSAPLLQLLFLAAIAISLVAIFQANAHDFGLPVSWKQATEDCGIGTLACLAVFLPVYLVQFSLIITLDPETHHPLIKQLQENPSTQTLLIAFTMAVIAAPLFEEFLFRVLLQGWLERCEDEALAHDTTLRQPPISLKTEADDEGQNNQPLLSESNPAEMNNQPPIRGWIPLLPHGWTPILISGTIFGLAHLGHGVAPIPLILFGIVLGYLFQRTHRILPSIAAHMLFNAYTMLQLWLLTQYPPANQ